MNYMFPSGVAELAERAGFVLTEACSVRYPTLYWSSRLLTRALRARTYGIVAAKPHLWPFALDLPNSFVTPWQWLALARRRHHQWLGEHAIYVFTRS